mmetsp:Transcript_10091/g.11800  ORF Transcript_10091/g.11800 Transcript_10091/m.11800 type:complete len:609 (+) Transcript_10091:167-1993(+)
MASHSISQPSVEQEKRCPLTPPKKRQKVSEHQYRTFATLQTQSCNENVQQSISIEAALQAANLQHCVTEAISKNLTLSSVLRAGLERFGVMSEDPKSEPAESDAYRDTADSSLDRQLAPPDNSQWQDMQSDLLESIFQQGGPEVAAMACTVCRRWNKVASSSHLWEAFCQGLQPPKERIMNLSWKQSFPLRDGTSDVVEKQQSLGNDFLQILNRNGAQHRDWTQLLNSEHAVVIDRKTYIKSHMNNLKASTIANEVKEISMIHIQALFGSSVARPWRKRTARMLLEDSIVPVLLGLTRQRTCTRMTVNAVRLLYDITLCDPVRLGTLRAASHFPAIAPALVAVLTRIATGDSMLGFATCVRLCVLGIFSHLMKYGVENQKALVEANGLRHVVAHLQDPVPRTAHYAGKTLKYLARTSYGYAELATFTGSQKSRQKILKYAATQISNYKLGHNSTHIQQMPNLLIGHELPNYAMVRGAPMDFEDGPGLAGPGPVPPLRPLPPVPAAAPQDEEGRDEGEGAGAADVADVNRNNDNDNNDDDNNAAVAATNNNNNDNNDDAAAGPALPRHPFADQELADLVQRLNNPVERTVRETQRLLRIAIQGFHQRIP